MKLKYCFLLVLLCVLLGSTQAQRKKKGGKNDKHAEEDVEAAPPEPNLADYLTEYGYLAKPPDGVQQNPEDINLALAELQKFAGLEPTGILDEPTRALLAKTRCGVKDVIGSAEMDIHVPGGSVRLKRYNTQYDIKWTKTALNYYITNFTPDLSQREIRTALTRAFQVWSDVSPLTFTETSDPNYGDIVIQFGAGKHGDIYAPFDGEGGTLAHAYFPEDGDAHFDEDETWTVGTDEGTNLFIVAAHEFGHSLGLGHSDVQEALMYPWYKGYIPDFELSDDDRLGIQYLYGMPDVSRSPPNDEPPIKEGRPDTCTSDWDAVILGPDSKTYAFKGNYYWLIGDEKVSKGYPKGITKLLGEDAPTNIHAAVTSLKTGKTYIFKGDRMWRYTNFQKDRGFPKKAVKRGVPKGPAAAFTWGANGNIYIFKGNKYYIFEEEKMKVVRAPKKIKKDWKGVPSKIHAAFQWKNGKTYFFKGDNYWRFNDAKRKIDKDYPRSKALYWMGCGRAGQQLPERIQTGPQQGR